MIDWWEVARAKKDPDQFVDFESARLARLEKLQAEHDEVKILLESLKIVLTF